MKVQVVYSIGVRCYTEIILKRLGYVKFSSLFGSMNLRNYRNITSCFTDFTILFDESNLLYTKHIPSMAYNNHKYGCRTLHKLFDNVDDYHSATIAHHDLSTIEHKEHFARALNRLYYIRDHRIPILFVNISMEYDNTKYDADLVNSILQHGFNMKILSIYKTNTVDKLTLIKTYPHMILYKMPTYGYDHIEDDKMIDYIIRLHFNCDNLMTIHDFPG